MSIGYACKVIGVMNTKIGSCSLKNATSENLRWVTAENLAALDRILDYNISNGIRLFRISSDIIPFGSHEANTLDWRNEFKTELSALGSKIKRAGIRVSMHPGQYTVLNSPNENTVKRALEDIRYHAGFLDSLEADFTSKIVLHIGGAYDDKQEAISRFIKEFKKLEQDVKRRIVIENDDKIYNIEDVLSVSHAIHVPVVFDYLHHNINPPENAKTSYEWISECSETWRDDDGRQKIHYSEENELLKRGSHSDTIKAETFLDFYSGLCDKSIDIMLEVKDKNLSAVKCIICTDQNIRIKELEAEWARYKYLVLSRSAALYQEIRQLLKEKEEPDAVTFYKIIEKALSIKADKGAEINAAQHVWGYFKDTASEKERSKFKLLLQRLETGETKAESVKNFLFKCALDRKELYLLNSLYFYLSE